MCSLQWPGVMSHDQLKLHALSKNNGTINLSKLPFATCASLPIPLKCLCQLKMIPVLFTRLFFKPHILKFLVEHPNELMVFWNAAPQKRELQLSACAKLQRIWQWFKRYISAKNDFLKSNMICCPLAPNYMINLGLKGHSWPLKRVRWWLEWSKHQQPVRDVVV